MTEERIRVASIYDSALDHVAMKAGGIAYAQSRLESDLVIVDGRDPTWFTIGYLTRAQRRWAEAAPTEAVRLERAFAIGVRLIENLRTPPPRENFAQYVPNGHVSIQGAGKVPCYESDQLDKIPEAYLEDIGAIVWHRSFLGHEPDLSFPAAHLSLSALQTVVSRRAGDRAKSSASED